MSPFPRRTVSGFTAGGPMYIIEDAVVGLEGGSSANVDADRKKINTISNVVILVFIVLSFC